MRKTFITSVIVILSILAVSSFASAQGAGRGGRAAAAAAPDNRPFDAHDLSGYWFRDGGSRTIKGTKAADVPAMTPEGEAKLRANIPARGRNLGEPVKDEHWAFVRAVVPAKSNDPILQCDPQGLPRLTLDSEPTEWIQLPGRLLQYYQWGHMLREIWMDGRELPKGEALDNLGSSWLGMSVGKWEGDTLVVNTVGFNDKTWLDIHGFPHTSEMRLEERYRRVSADKMEWTFTIYDPKYYKTPWESDKKSWRRMAKSEVSYEGWEGFSGFLESYCVWSTENEFNERIENPAGIGKKNR